MNIQQHIFYLAAAVGLASACACNSSTTKQPQGERPNVIIINVDDLGYGDVGCYGATKIKTPNIDKLAGEGVRFTDFHVASSVCSPSRYALITGRYPGRADLWSPIFLRTPLVVDTNQLTIADVMKKAGYATAVIGKWHLGFQVEAPLDWNKELKPGPLELGFDYYFGVPILNSHPPFVYVENHRVAGWEASDPFVYGQRAATDSFPEKFGLSEIGGATKAHQLYKDRMIGTKLKDKATEWIREHKDEPFFLYFATTNNHHPFTPAERFVGSSEAGRYGDAIHELDWMVGELMGELDKQGLRDNTLVIFTSDNGGMLNQGGQDAWKAGHRLNGDLLGFKFEAWEGGHRVPFIARWPGKIAPATISNEIVCNTDLLATMADLTSYTLQRGEGPDSFSALSALLGDTTKRVRDFIVIHPNKEKNLAIRKGKWLYVSAQNAGGFGGTKIGEHTLGGAAAHLLTKQVNSDVENGKIKPGAPPAQLYDLETDPQQRENVYLKYPGVAAELKQLMHHSVYEQSATRND